jgi:outer membrane protein assembly factor BamB
MMNKDENIIRILRLTGYISGLFTLFVAVIMILGYIQLESIKPLENPALEQLKQQYDKDPNNEDLKEQVRALDLMARRAFFATRWQIETGTYLLIIAVSIFVVSQRLLIIRRRRDLSMPADEFDLIGKSKRARSYLIISSLSVTLLAFIISFLLRKDLPDPISIDDEILSEGVSQIRVSPGNTTPAENTQLPDAPESNEDLSGEVNMDETVQEEKNITGEQLSTQYISNSNNFPFFRGEGSRGLVGSGGFPTTWDGKTGENILWKVRIPLPGYSSPIIWDDRIFLTGAEGASTEVMCLNKTSGELIWRAEATGIEGEPKTPPKTSEDTGLAAPTAATNGEVVCAIFATGNLICLDFEGNRLWAKNLGVPDNHYGHSSSLIIHDNILLVQYDHFVSKSIMAFDVLNGTKLWETTRQVAISWASPVLASFGGKIQVILSSEPYVSSYDVYSGQELWSAQCMSGEVGPSVGVNSKKVFAVNDFAVLAGIDPLANGNVIWKDNEYTPEVASPVATEELVFVLTTWGAVACYDTDTGELVWDHDFDYGFYASPIIAGDNVYMLDQAGVMHIVKASREFTLVSEPVLGERANCTPAFSSGMIFLRSDDHLYCIGK